MEFIIFWLSIIVFGLISFIFFFHSQKTKSNATKLPPGNSGLPIIGESIKFMSAGENGKPESFVKERMAKYSPDVFKTSLGGEKMAVFCGAGGNKLVLSNNKEMVEPWWPATFDKILISKGSSVGENKHIRSLVKQFLRPEALNEHVPVMDSLMTKYMNKNWLSNETIHAFPSLKKMVFTLSCRLVMNIEEPLQVDELQGHFSHIFPGLLAAPIDFPGTVYNRAIKAARKIREILFPIIKERRARKGLDDNSDLLTYLIGSTKEDGKIIDNEIADSVLAVIVASTDNTSSVC